MDVGNKTRRRKISFETSRTVFTEKANKVESHRLEKQLATMEATAHKNMVHLFRRRLSTQEMLACLQRQEGDSCLADRENRPRRPAKSSTGDRENSTDENTDKITVRGRSRSMGSADNRVERHDASMTFVTSLGVEGLDDIKSSDDVFEDCLQNLKITPAEPSDADLDVPTKTPQISKRASLPARPKSAPLRWRHRIEKTTISAPDSTISSNESSSVDVHKNETASQKDQTKTSPLLPVNISQYQEPSVRVPRGTRRPVRPIEVPKPSQEDTENAPGSPRSEIPQADHETKEDSPRQPHKPRLLTRAEKLGMKPVLLLSPGVPQQRRQRSSSTVTGRPPADAIGPCSASNPDKLLRPNSVVPRVRKISAMSHAEFMNDAIRSKAYGIIDLDSPSSGEEVSVLLPLRPHTAGGARKLHRALAITDQKLDVRMQAFLKRPLPGETKHN